MINYSYSPAELKIIMGIAYKNKIPVSFNYDDEVSIIVHSKYDFKPLLKFSEHGFKILSGFNFNDLKHNHEVGEYTIKFMQAKETIGL